MDAKTLKTWLGIITAIVALSGTVGSVWYTWGETQTQIRQLQEQVRQVRQAQQIEREYLRKAWSIACQAAEIPPGGCLPGA